MKLIAIFSVVLIIFNIQSHVSAIRCYECTNMIGEPCEKVDDSLISDCQAGITTCLKVTLKSKFLKFKSVFKK